jgi:hypothetical protein
MQRGLPSAEFRLKKIHLFFLLDLVIAAGLFALTGNVYMSRRGDRVIAIEEQKRAEARLEFKELLSEADSVMAYQQQALASMRVDSVGWFQTYERMRAQLEAGFAERQTISGNVFQLAEIVQNMKSRTQEAIVQADGYEKDVTEQRERIGSLTDESTEFASKLDSTKVNRRQAAENLREAYADRTYEPVGYFPDRSGVAVKSEVTANERITSVEVQRVLTSRRAFDLGLALGVGVGSGDRASSKELGVLVSRPLVHRRLGMDLAAGYEHLTDEAGNNNGGAYAAAGLRYSPLYKERLHFGLGARASDGEVLPYISVSVGRR